MVIHYKDGSSDSLHKTPGGEYVYQANGYKYFIAESEVEKISPGSEVYVKVEKVYDTVYHSWDSKGNHALIGTVVASIDI